MTVLPHRLAEAALGGQAGRLIDRTKTIRFTFDGKTMSGFAGDTLASALMANGVRVVGRSFKYHRPRGLLGLGSEEPNGLVTIGEDNRLEPNVRATQVELYDGLTARSQNRWPSLQFDVGEINNRFSRYIPAGFYYKTFMHPRAFWKHIYEPVIRRAAGLGPAPKEADPDRYEHVHIHCDVLVVGGGIAGLAAARSAMEAGARVILADENSRLGGVSDLNDEKIEGENALAWISKTTEELAASETVHLLTRTTATGHFDHNYVVMCERVCDHDPARLKNGAPRHRLWKVRTKEVVLATGSIERPITFADNDKPGVMLASAVRGYIARYAVTPGSAAVLFTNNDDAYRTFTALYDAGVTLTRIIDSRPAPDSILTDKAKALGIPLSFGSGISSVKTEDGGKCIAGVSVTSLTGGGGLNRPIGAECDFICMSGGFNPAVHLFSHGGGKLIYDETLQAFRPGETRERIRVAGAANGVFETAKILAEGILAGWSAARDALPKGAAKGRAPRPPKADAQPISPSEPVWFVPAHGEKNEGNKHFLDFQNDVTVADVELANREGYRSVEHVKRYTTLGMATDQGKTSNINALGILSEALGKTIPEIGTTTFRPPYTPFSFGAFVGPVRGKLFQPVRRTPIQSWHEDIGAEFEPIGQWRRPYCYPKGSERRSDAVKREVLAVRNAAGLLDASTLGKIEVRGPDAGTFLDLIYTNTMSTLKAGRCRYGLMLNDSGFLFDDGVTVRFADEHFLVHTTSGNSDHIGGWLERWHQTEWPHLKVFMTPVTEQWAQFALAGPKARAVLEALESDIDFSGGAFPFLSFKEGRLAGVPVRVYRISFSGELSFEIATPAGFGQYLWTALMKAGEGFDIAPYGTEALHVMRAEKGFIAIGDETDGTVTPLDLGLSWAVSKKKKDFIGKRALELPDLARNDRRHFIGLLTEDPQRVLPEGAQAVADPRARPPHRVIGYVSSTYFSPTLERSIAFGLIERGRERMGETIHFAVGGTMMPAEIVDPVFYDKEGERQNV